MSTSPRQVRQLDAQRFEVVETSGTVTSVTLRRDTRLGLGLRSVPASTVVGEVVAMLEEDGRWPPTASAEPIEAVGMLALMPGALDDLRARLSG